MLLRFVSSSLPARATARISLSELTTLSQTSLWLSSSLSEIEDEDDEADDDDDDDDDADDGDDDDDDEVVVAAFPL